MPLIIATDEAGYGPNLGPLVVGATLWQVPNPNTDLYQTLQPAICRAAEFRTTAASGLPIGDSKSLYQSRGSLATLERSVLVMLGACQQVPRDIRQLLQFVAPDAVDNLGREATYCWNQQQVPVDCDRQHLKSQAKTMQEILRQARIGFSQMAARVVFPDEFNACLSDFGNKANLLSGLTCRLIHQLIERVDPQRTQEIVILCDKHGGRSRYAGLLQQELTECLVQIVNEGRESSVYRWQEGERRVTARFLAKGEQHLPIGLASMLAKYLRELSMQAFNRFWCQRLPSLRPTAGYPQDALRFKKDIADLQTELRLPDQCIWRRK